MSFLSVGEKFDINKLEDFNTSIDTNTVVNFIKIENETNYTFRIVTVSPNYILYFNFYDYPFVNTYNSTPNISSTVFLKKGLYLMYAKSDSNFIVEYSLDKKIWNNISNLLLKDTNTLPPFIIKKLNYCSTDLDIYETDDCKKVLSDLNEYIINFNFLNTTNIDINSTYSNWSEYEGCSKICGIDSKTRTKDYIPPMYNGIIENDKQIVEKVSCNKFCKTDNEIFNFWKTKTSCTSNIIPKSMNEKYLLNLEEKIESPYHIDNLKYSENDDDLYNLIKQWDAPIYINPSIECFSSKMLSNTSIKRGSSIYSADGASYFTYDIDGLLSYNIIDETGKYIPIWKPEINIKSDTCSLQDSKLVLMLNNNIVWYLDFGLPLISFLIDSYKIIIYSDNTYIVNIIGENLTELNANTKIKKSNVELKISDGNDPINYYLVFTNTGYLQFIDNINKKIIWTASQKAGDLLEINSDGICIKLNNVIIYKLECSNLNKILINSVGRIEMFDTNGYIIRYIGNAITSLSTKYIIKKPITLDIQLGVRIYSAKGDYYLEYQVGGNVVFCSKDNKVVWSSGTDSIKSDRLVLQPDGDLVIYDNKIIVWNAGVNFLVEDSPVLFLFDTGCMIFMDSKNKITKVLPECGDEIVKAYLENVWSTEAPSYVGVPHGYSYMEQIVNLDKVLESLNFNLCPPTELTCNLPFSNFQSGTSMKGYVDIEYNSLYWQNAKYLLTTNFTSGNKLDLTKRLSRINMSNSTYDINNAIVLGYKPIYKINGIKSNPIIAVRHIQNDIEYLYIFIKKDKDNFINDLKNNKNICNKVKNDKILLEKYLLKYLYLDGIESFGMHPLFKCEYVSYFENKDQPLLSEIYNNYLNDMYKYCENDNIFLEECLSLLKDKTIDGEYKNTYYNSRMSIQCKLQNNIINPECIEYMNKDDATKKYVNNYCKDHIFNNNCKKLCNKQFVDDIEFNDIFCNNNNYKTYLLLLLLIIFIIFGSFLVKHIYKKNKELEILLK